MFQFTTQLTLLQFAEFTLHLSRLSPEMLQIIRESGRLNVGYYKFEIDDNKGKYQMYFFSSNCLVCEGIFLRRP